MFSTHESSEEIRNRMIEIITEASQLQVIFLKSKALFRLIQDFSEGIEGKVELDESKMDVHYTHVERTEADREVYVYTPFLEKCGNADGHDGSFAKHTAVCLDRVAIG